MRVGICDDIGADRARLRAMLLTYFLKRSLYPDVELFSNAQALLESFSPGKYQLIFLDIYMPGLTGMDAAKRIREQDEDCALIFSTTSEDHALESYGVYAAGYLLKPHTQEQLCETLDWCTENMPLFLQTIDISSDREKTCLLLRDIIFIEVYGRKSIFHTTAREYTANRSLSSLEQELTSDFLRCHRCYIVNMNHIASLTSGGFLLTNGQTVPVGTETATRAKRIFFEWMYQKTWEGR